MYEEFLKENEYAEDLQFQNLHIILNKNLPAFTTDAVLLSDFARVKRNELTADLGTGTGIIALLMHGRYGMSAIGFELQEELCDMANRSFALNGLSDVLTAENMDYTQAYVKYNGVFSAAVCNPPYFPKDSGHIAPQHERAVTRSQLICGIEDVLHSAARLLKSGGKLFLCYPATALAELIFYMKKYSLEPKRMRFVRSRTDKAPYLVLTEARKDGGKGIIYEPDLIILNESGDETAEIKRIYHRKL